MRLCFGTVLPILMITVGMCIQKNSNSPVSVHSSSEHETEPLVEESPRLPQRLLNLALINRTCAPQLIAHYTSKELSGRSLGSFEDMSIAGGGTLPRRLLVGAGFGATGLSSLSALMAKVPGACHPVRPAVGLWTSLGGGSGGGGGGGG